MSYTLHQTDGIVLERWPRGEADSMVWFYTKDYGGVMIYAKAVRLEKSKLRSAIDVFNVSRIGFIAGKELYRLTYVETQKVYTRLLYDWEQYRVAYAISRMVRSTVADGESDEHLWKLLSDTFHALVHDTHNPPRLSLLLYSFELQFLNILGYLPRELPPLAHMLSVFDMIPTVSYSSEQMQELALFLQPIRAYAALQKKGIMNDI